MPRVQTRLLRRVNDVLPRRRYRFARGTGIGGRTGDRDLRFTIKRLSAGAFGGRPLARPFGDGPLARPFGCRSAPWALIRRIVSFNTGYGDPAGHDHGRDLSPNKGPKETVYSRRSRTGAPDP